MSAQIGDSIIIDDIEYEILSDDSLFSPLDYGLAPFGTCSACRRGYWCEYILREGKIILDKVHINTINDEYPPIDGVMAEPSKEKWDHYVYSGMNMNVDYNGKLLVGSGFIDKYYIHSGRQFCWAYESLLDYEFMNGIILHIDDKSKEADRYREVVEIKYDSSDEYGYLKLEISSELNLIDFIKGV